MDTQEPQGGDRGVWPPPPARELPTVTAPPPPGLDRAWVFGQVFGRMMLFGMAFGALGGAVFGGFVTRESGIALGLVFGLIYGVAVGMLLGLADGLVAAFMTCFGFFPLSLAKVFVYRNSITFVTIVLTLGGAWALSLMLFGDGGNGTIEGGDTLNAVLPTVIATVAAGAASWRVAAWYVAVSATRT